MYSMKTKMLLGHAQFHGARRLIEPRHRLCWAIGLIFLLWAALSNLSATVLRFLDAPTTLGASDTVWTKITFPSVLVCPEVYFPEYKIENLLAHAKYPAGMTADTIRPIIRQLTAFYSPDSPYTARELSQIHKFLEHNNLDVEKAGFLLTTSCKETLLRCRFYKEDLDCSDIFQMEITMYGYCCAFNGKSLKRELKLKREGKELHVWKTTEIGPFAALMLAVNQSQYLGNVDLTYKWLVVQSSNRYVEATKNGTPISPERETWSSFHSEFITIGDESLYMGDQLRGCVFETKKLKYYPVNDKKVCLTECLMEQIMRHCKCLLPVHYRPPGVPLCHARNLPCARKSIEQFQKGLCDCPFACWYQSEISDTETYELSSKAKSFDSFYYGLNFSQVSVVRVFIKSHQTTSFCRRPVFNFYDLYSQLGGVFNVFFGCSILSILELLQLAAYYFKDRFQSRTHKLTLKTVKRRKKTRSFLFGTCCGARNGRVGKRVAKKKHMLFKRTLIYNLKM